MSNIRTKPATPEYEKGWERIFKNFDEPQYGGGIGGGEIKKEGQDAVKEGEIREGS